jgi:hypothetical protein
VIDLIVVHGDDNVATALRDLRASAPARVTGPAGEVGTVTPARAIPLGHKVALRGIEAGALVVKHGHPIGRATAPIAAGDHVHVQNVISLSRETDVAPAEGVSP